MATQTRAIKFEEHITCPICLGIYRHPRSLSCQHPLCEECAARLPVITRNESGTMIRLIKCPTCREESVLPGGTAVNLPPAFQTNTLIDLYEAASALPDVTPPPATRKCSEHQRDIELYCEQCKVRMCTACMLRDHSSHKCDMLTDLSVKNREEVSVYLGDLQQQVGVITNALANIDSQEESIKQQGVTVKEEIDVLIEELIEKLCCSGRKLKVSVDNSSHEQLAELLAMREEGQMTLGQLQSCAGHVDRILKTETDLCNEKTELIERISDVCALVHTNKIIATSNSKAITLLPNTVLLDNCSILGEVSIVTKPPIKNQITTTLEHATHLPQTTPTQVKPMTTTPMEAMPMAPPTQSEVVSPVKALAKPVSASASGKGFMFSVVNMQSQVQIKLSATVDDLVSCHLCHKDTNPAFYRVECTVKEVVEGRSFFSFFGSHSPKSYDISYVPTQSGPHELKVEVGGVAIPCDPCAILVQPSLDMRISGLKVFKEGHSKPHSIAVTDDNLIVYSDLYLGKKSIIICDASGKRIRQFGVNIVGDSLPLAVTHDNHIILVDTEDCAIKKVTMKGVIVNFKRHIQPVASDFNSLVQLSPNFLRPQSVVVDVQNCVYVSDTCTCTIVKLSPDLAHTLCNYPLYRYNCFSLAGMCIDAHETLFICNRFKDCVLKVNSSGVLGKINIKCPEHVAIDHSTNVVCIISKYMDVARFDGEGELLDNVGYSSTFDTPTAIAHGPDGTVYVCDYARGTIVAF